MEKASIDFTALFTQAITRATAENIQKAKEREAELGHVEERKQEGKDTTTWYVTPEQIERINNGDRQAVDEFFEDNARHLLFLSLSILRRIGCLENKEHKKLVESGDLINQAYLDMRGGFLFFRYSRLSITKTIARSMRYAPVGGVDPTRRYEFGTHGKIRR